MTGAKVTFHFSEAEWQGIRAAATRSGLEPYTLVLRALGLGWPAVLREVDRVPPPPRTLTLVK